MKALRTVILPMVLALVAGCGGSGGTPVSPVSEGDVLWRVEGRYLAGGSVLFAGGRVVTSDDTDIVARDPSDGSEVWRRAPNPDYPFVPPEIASGEGTVYGFQLASAVAVSASDGTVAWRGENLPVGGAPLVDRDRIFAGGRGTVTALDRATGAVVWIRDIGRIADVFVGADGDAVCAVTRLLVLGETPPQEDLLCLDRADGRIRWRFTDPRLRAPTGLVVDAGRAIVGTGAGWLLAVDAATGELAWESPLPAGLESAPTVSQGTVIACTNDQGDPACVRLRTADGSAVWSTPISWVAGRVRPVVDAGTVWILDRGALVGLDLASGARTYDPIRPPVGFPIFLEAPAIHEGVAYVASEDHLFAIRVGSSVLPNRGTAGDSRTILTNN